MVFRVPYIGWEESILDDFYSHSGDPKTVGEKIEILSTFFKVEKMPYLQTDHKKQNYLEQLEEKYVNQICLESSLDHDEVVPMPPKNRERVKVKVIKTRRGQPFRSNC